LEKLPPLIWTSVASIPVVTFVGLSAYYLYIRHQASTNRGIAPNSKKKRNDRERLSQERREKEWERKAVEYRPDLKRPFCVICKKECETEAGVEAHMRAVHQNYYEKDFDSHPKWQDAQTPMLICNTCQKTFKNLNGLKLHKEAIHNPNGADLLICVDCHKICKGSNGLHVHRLSKHPDKERR
jgi:hypothetical protein